MVYSTCSFAVEENEGVIDYAIRKLNVKVLDCNLEVENKTITRFKGKVYSDKVKKCVRVLPHVHNLDGFFIAKLQKLKAKETGSTKNKKIKKTKTQDKKNQN